MKKILRKKVRELKGQYTDEQLRTISTPIVNRLLEHTHVQQAQTIMAYHSLPDEVFTHQLLDTLTAMGKEVLLPHVEDDGRMTVRQYRSPKDMKTGAYGISEPIGEEYSNLEDIDLIVIPGVAFDTQGNRCGRGRGYYDRFLSTLLPPHSSQTKQKRPHLIGIAFPFQIFSQIPTDDYDIRMDEVIYR